MPRGPICVSLSALFRPGFSSRAENFKAQICIFKVLMSCGSPVDGHGIIFEGERGCCGTVWDFQGAVPLHVQYM